MSVDDAEAEAALFAWMESAFSIRCATLKEMVSPEVLSQVVEDIDDKRFRDIQPQASKVADKLLVLKELVQKMEEMYEEHSSKFYEATPNLAMALSGSKAEAIKVMKLVLVLCVLCEKRERYIGSIMGLEHEHQVAIMALIGPEVMEDAAASSQVEREIVLEQQLAVLMKEKELWLSERNVLTAEIESLENRVVETSEEDATQDEHEHSSEVQLGKIDEDTKAYIFDLEEQLKSYKAVTTQHEQSIKELSSALERNLDSGTENERLKEKLRDTEQQLTRLSKIESVAEKYKRKLQDTKDVEKLVERLESENAELKKRLQDRTLSGKQRLESTPPPAESKPKIEKLGAVSNVDESVDQIRILLQDPLADTNDTHEAEHHFGIMVEELNNRERQVTQLTQELKLISGAWYAIASRVQQQNAAVTRNSHTAPKGWLSRQRQALNKLI